MSTLQQRAEEIAEELSYLDREERFEWIIDTGKELKTVEDFQDHELVKGCQSKVWLRVWQEENKLRLIGTSDALLVKGIVSLLISIFDKATVEESKAFNFIEWMNTNQVSLSMQRMQGLEDMLRRIQG
jgi:cysteine desulfuration protein SufE